MWVWSINYYSHKTFICNFLDNENCGNFQFQISYNIDFRFWNIFSLLIVDTIVGIEPNWNIITTETVPTHGEIDFDAC